MQICDLLGLTALWRFESFSYSHHFWVNVVYLNEVFVGVRRPFFLFDFSKGILQRFSFFVRERSSARLRG